MLGRHPGALEPVLVTRKAPVGPPAAYEDDVQGHAGDEATCVRPKRHTAHDAWLRKRQRPAEDLAERPEAKGGDSGSGEEDGEEQHRKHHDDVGMWKKHEVCPEYSCDCS